MKPGLKVCPRGYRHRYEVPIARQLPADRNVDVHVSATLHVGTDITKGSTHLRALSPVRSTCFALSPDGLLSAERSVEVPLVSVALRSVVSGEGLPDLFASSWVIRLEPEDSLERDSAADLSLDLSAADFFASPVAGLDALFSFDFSELSAERPLVSLPFALGPSGPPTDRLLPPASDPEPRS